MNILILMAGNDKDFSAKYNMPKYLLNVNNKTLLERNLDILSRLCKNSNDRIYCVIRKADQEKYFFKDMIKVLLPSANVLEVNGDTKGAVCSALYAIKYIDSKEELMIYNGSQLVKADLTNCIQDFQQRKLDVGIIAFNAVDYKYSTLLLDSDNNVIQASEKRPISNCASTGCVYFKNGHEFVKSAMTIIEKNDEFSGYFYVSAVINQMILESKKVSIYLISKKDYVNFSRYSYLYTLKNREGKND